MLIFSLYGFTYWVVGQVDGAQVFRSDRRPTFNAMVKAAVWGEDDTTTGTTWHSGVSRAGGMFTVHAQ